MSPVKEPCYFLSPATQIRIGTHIRTKKQYLELFRNAKGAIAIGEASPAYLANPESAGLIHEAVPDARIIIMLRHPVERAFSGYLMHQPYGENLPFVEAVKEELSDPSAEFGSGYRRRYIFSSLYSASVKRYFDTFGRDHVKVLIFEEFVQNTRQSVEEVLKFLGIDVQSIPDSIAQVHNPYRVAGSGSVAKFIRYLDVARRRHATLHKAQLLIPESIKDGASKIALKEAPKPKMSEEERAFVENIFYDDVQKLSIILGRSLPWAFSTKGM
jgi:hypothetical protein